MSLEQNLVNRRVFLKLAAIASAAMSLSSVPVLAESPVPFKEWRSKWGLGEVAVRRTSLKPR